MVWEKLNLWPKVIPFLSNLVDFVLGTQEMSIIGINKYKDACQIIGRAATVMHKCSWVQTNFVQNQQYNSASAESMSLLDQPKSNYLKRNMDFTLLQQHNKFGFGAIVKDHQVSFSHGSDSLVHEYDWEVDHIKFEPDCKSDVHEASKHADSSISKSLHLI
ncbi:hypothetical protein TSUD_130750 [Trifolium subterraneum]|nr:hypothetical protein TSUD_130750 [Trifolium subterraneum]